MKRVLPFILVLCLLLCGCNIIPTVKDQTRTDTTQLPQSPRPTIQHTPQDPEPQKPEQITLSDEELAPILQQTEYSLLAAAFLYDAYENPTFHDRYAHVGDMDNDGDIEMYYSDSLLYFDPTDKKECSYFYSPSGAMGLYLSKDGSIYYNYSVDYDSVQHGDHVDDVIPLYYSTRNPDAPSFDLITPECSKTSTPETWVKVNGTNLSPEESRAFLDDLALTPVETGLQDYTAFTYDAAYSDSILAALEGAFGSFQGTFTVDIDRDNQEEHIFTYTHFVNGWFPEDAINPDLDPYFGAMSQAFCFDYPGINPVDNRSGLIVADQQGDKLVLKAYSVPDIVTAGIAFADLYVDGTTLYIDGNSWFVPQAIEESNQYVYLESTLQKDGYTNIFFVTADLSGKAEKEILCIGKQNGHWVLLVIRFDHGVRKILETVDLSDSACYLSSYEGKDCLVVYRQSQSNRDEGLYTSYAYKLFRFDGNSFTNVILSNSVGHYNNQENASNISEFFAELNRYIVNVIVIYDPFSLHGQEWIDSEDVVHGEVPEESAPPEQPDTPSPEKIGFVNISNPSSWLNLREGPGRNYPCILTNPSDPDSIVKQAKGSPVTVLETVESEDPDFPVWYKVRIRYQNREIIGYSAEAYIQLTD
ncbi:MAG: SH3 domain-containing protein [Ruminococcaceae bacterium]|nr:SH3 domain-containing protein [Oscillospiraceae bacterium]